MSVLSAIGALFVTGETAAFAHANKEDGHGMMDGSGIMGSGMFGFGILGMLVFFAFIGLVVYMAVKLANKSK
jgi:heme/copper-type cytochrome/quinol oxidase subunit 3